MPHPDKFDFLLPENTDLHSHLFRNSETGKSWSVNDLWLQLQEATNPFVEIKMGARPQIKTACFPYPGNVTIETLDGPKRIGDVLLSVALSLEVEKVNLDSATKVEYVCTNGDTTQRIEFASREPGMNDWRISLQLPKDAKNLNQLRTRYDLPDPSSDK